MIQLMQGLQHTLVKRDAVRHHRQSSHLVFDLVPNLWKQRRMIGVLVCDAMHFSRPEVVFIGHWLHKAVETLHNLIIPNDDNTHAASTGHLAIGAFKVDGSEVT